LEKTNSFTTEHQLRVHSAEDLSGLADGSVDLVVTSPPYPMIEMWDESFSRQSPEAARALEAADGPAAFEAMHLLLDRVWGECYRVLLPGGFACINIGDATRSVGGGFRLYSNHSRITGACEALGFQSLPPIHWRKQTNAPNKFMGSGMLPAGAYVTLEHEYILIFRKGDKRKFDPLEAERRRRSAFFWEERNRWFSDVWDFKGSRQALGAPGGFSRLRGAVFPFELAYRLILMYSLEGDRVLDPFMGTGTTVAAAMAAGRSSVGVEIDASFSEKVVELLPKRVSVLNDRISERLEGHREFLRSYREKKGREPAYQNRHHHFAVVTRQETELRIYFVDSIEKIDEGRLRTTYRTANGGQNQLPLP